MFEKKTALRRNILRVTSAVVSVRQNFNDVSATAVRDEKRPDNGRIRLAPSNNSNNNNVLFQEHSALQR